MSRYLPTRALAVLATAAVLIVAGCSTDVDDGGVQETGKVADPAQIKADQKKFMESMKGNYIKAPGAPAPKS
jgi:protein involved in sex pheromone biosynthesis